MDIDPNLIIDLRGAILHALRTVRESSGDEVSAIANIQRRTEERHEERTQPAPKPCRCGCGGRGDSNRRGLAYACYRKAVADGTLDTLYPARRSRGNPLHWSGRQVDDR